MTIYAAIAASVMPVLPRFAVGGPSFTGTRPSGDGISADVTTSVLSARTIYFIPAKLEQFQATFPDVQLFTAPWYGFARAGVDLRAGDTYTDGTSTYQITGVPVTEYGFVLAPAAPCGVSGYGSAAMGISTALAASIMPVLPQFAVGGPSFTGARPAGDGVSADVTLDSLSARTIYFIPAKLEQFRQALPGIELFTAPWLGFARAGVDLRAGDVYTDGTRAYQITGVPAVEYGFVLAPAAPCDVAAALAAGVGYRSPLWILGMAA